MLGRGARADFPSGSRSFNDIVAVHTDEVELDVGALGQLTAAVEGTRDPAQDEVRPYLYIPTGRLRMEGRYDAFGFNLELTLDGEDSTIPAARVDPGLQVLSFNVPLSSTASTYLKVGQFRVPYGREELSYAGNLQFDRTSLESLGFDAGYDVGLAVVSVQGPLTLIGGVFTGEGRGVALSQYEPERIGVPLLVVRASMGQADNDPFYLHQNDFLWDRDRASLSMNGLYTHDSLVGATTALAAKQVNKSLLTDTAWNPYLAQAPLSQGDWWQMGGDVALRMAFGDVLCSSELQFDYGGFSNAYGALHMAGGRAQAGVGLGRLEVSARYAFLIPHGDFSDRGVSITDGSRAMQELTPGVTWYVRGQSLKVLLDVPVLWNDVVIRQAGFGATATSDVPDQVAALPLGATAGRQTVIEARLQAQAQF